MTITFYVIKIHLFLLQNKPINTLLRLPQHYKGTVLPILSNQLNFDCLLCYVMCNLFTVGRLQFPNDSTIASLEANKNRPKIKNYVNK